MAEGKKGTAHSQHLEQRDRRVWPVGSAVLGFTGRENTAKNQKENTVKKIRKRYRLGILVAMTFFPVCALLAPGMPGASAASTPAQPTSSSMTTVKFADSAFAASAATRSTAPPSAQGPQTRPGRPRGTGSCVAYLTPFYPNISSTALNGACLLATLPTPPHLQNLAIAGCVGGLLVLTVSIFHAIVACNLSAESSLPFTQQQWCDYNTDCLNAWSGGPYVKVYTGGTETGDSNQNFYLADVDNSAGQATGYYHMIFAGSGSWADQCVGDYNNNSGLADAGLDGCGNATGGGTGWGTNMEVGTNGCPSGELWVYDVHWNGYLAGDGANGSKFYLNVANPVCFTIYYVGG
jgi:hypothetical protein